MSCKQEKQFQSVFPNGTFFKPALDEIIFSEKIEKFKIKSAFWKFYLTVFPRISSPSAGLHEWSRMIKQSRSQYLKIRKRFIINIDEISDSSKLGPLSQENPKWNQYFEDEKQMTQIITDTNRLYQEFEFFQDQENIKHINEIIFLHLRRFKIEYKQGFHELCGIVYYVFKNEMKSEKKNFQDDLDNNFGYNFLFSKDPNDIDADVFWTYTTLIEYVKPFYQVSNNIKKPPFCVQISEYIIGDQLKKYDPELSMKINVGDCFASIIPWTRLFFSRQFDLDDIPLLWTNIFTFFPNIDVICFISISIIMSYREKLLACTDENAVLMMLMNIHVDSPKEVTNKGIQLFRNRIPTKKDQGKLSHLSEGMCCEIEKVIKDIQVVPKDKLILQLKKFRDSLNLIVKSEKDEELVQNSDMDMLQTLPISSHEDKKKKRREVSTFELDDLSLEMSPIYSNSQDQDNNNANDI